MNMPSKNQFITAGRYVVTYASGFITSAVALHISSPEQGQGAMAAISQIASGLASVYTGVVTLIGFGAGVWGVISGGIRAQIALVQDHPNAQVTVTDPKLAAGIPGVKVVKK